MVKIDLNRVKMEIQLNEMVPDIKDPAYLALVKLGGETENVIYKRVAYRLNGVWHYLFRVDGRKPFIRIVKTWDNFLSLLYDVRL